MTLAERRTPEELADHLESCTREERVELCLRLLAAQVTAEQCFIRNHEADVDAARRLRTENADLHLKIARLTGKLP